LDLSIEKDTENNPSIIGDDNLNKGELNVQTEKSYSLWAIAGAALVDSINPCAIAVLLILLTALMMGAESKKKALLGGLAFTFSIYITYFLFGLGLLQLIAVANLANIIAKIVGVVALVIGLANIKDYFFYGGGGFVMEIPRAWRPALKKILNGITSPIGAFFAGFVVTLFELPCTGGPYFFVIGLLSQAENITNIIPTLLFYNLVFILPLILITFIVYFGVSSIEGAEKWKEKNIRALHLVAGIIMLALGVWVFFI
jgi:cytochrome c biogenesis protein CcdA